MRTYSTIITHQPTGKMQSVLQLQSELCKILQSIHYFIIKIHFLFFRKNTGTGKKTAGTGNISLTNPSTRSRTSVTDNTWIAYIRTSRSITKPVTHWIPERQYQKLFIIHIGKNILLSIHYAQLNYIHTLTHFITIMQLLTGKTPMVLQCQSKKHKKPKLIHYSKIKIHLLSFRNNVGTGKKSAGIGNTSTTDTPTGSKRRSVTGNIRTAYIRTSRPSIKPVTHWVPDRQDQKLFSTLTGKNILFNIHSAQLNYIHTLSYYANTTQLFTGKTHIALQCQSKKCKICQSIHYIKIKIHSLYLRISAETGKAGARTGKKSAVTGNILPTGTFTGSRTADNINSWTVYIRPSRSSTKSVTHWALKSQDQKLSCAVPYSELFVNILLCSKQQPLQPLYTAIILLSPDTADSTTGGANLVYINYITLQSHSVYLQPGTDEQDYICPAHCDPIFLNRNKTPVSYVQVSYINTQNPHSNPVSLLPLQAQDPIVTGSSGTNKFKHGKRFFISNSTIQYSHHASVKFLFSSLNSNTHKYKFIPTIETRLNHLIQFTTHNLLRTNLKLNPTTSQITLPATFLLKIKLTHYKLNPYTLTTDYSPQSHNLKPTILTCVTSIYSANACKTRLLTHNSSNSIKSTCFRTFLHIHRYLKIKIICKFVFRSNSPWQKTEDLSNLTEVLHKPACNPGSQQYINTSPALACTVPPQDSLVKVLLCSKQHSLLPFYTASNLLSLAVAGNTTEGDNLLYISFSIIQCYSVYQQPLLEQDHTYPANCVPSFLNKTRTIAGTVQALLISHLHPHYISFLQQPLQEQNLIDTRSSARLNRLRHNPEDPLNLIKLLHDSGWIYETQLYINLAHTLVDTVPSKSLQGKVLCGSGVVTSKEQGLYINSISSHFTSVRSSPSSQQVPFNIGSSGIKKLTKNLLIAKHNKRNPNINMHNIQFFHLISIFIFLNPNTHKFKSLFSLKTHPSFKTYFNTCNSLQNRLQLYPIHTLPTTLILSLKLHILTTLCSTHPHYFQYE